MTGEQAPFETIRTEDPDGLRWIHRATVDSTNLLARTMLPELGASPLLISADTQTAGRGRLGRVWSSPIGGAWMTLVIPDEAMPPPALGAAPLIVGLGVSEALDDAIREANPAAAHLVHTWIKWPNDVLVRGASGFLKLAGILCERVAIPDEQGMATLIGIGINVNTDPGEIETREGGLLPTTLREVASCELPVRLVIEHVAQRVLARLARATRDELDPDTRTEIESRLAYRDGGRSRVRINQGPEPVEGEVLGIDGTGKLVLRTHKGISTIGSAELIPVARAGNP